jgi:putative endonuclease
MARIWSVGQEGEQYAAERLHEEGFVILERNWRQKPYEVDLITLFNDILVFVEVKTRVDPGYAIERWGISQAKKRALTNAAYAYMEQVDWRGEFRFDIVTLHKWETEWKFTHYADAFFPGIQGV